MTKVKELGELNKDEIINQELIGGGLPDLETEIAKLQADGGNADSNDGGFGGDLFGGSNDGGFGGFGFDEKSKPEPKDEEEED